VKIICVCSEVVVFVELKDRLIKILAIYKKQETFTQYCQELIETRNRQNIAYCMLTVHHWFDDALLRCQSNILHAVNVNV